MAESTSRLTIKSDTILRVMLFTMMAVGSISFVEPSPYEFFFLAMVPLVFFGHLIITRVTLVLFFLVIVFLGAEVLALMPYLQDRPTPTEDGPGATALIYTLQTIYLFVSALMFAVIFTRHTKERVTLALNGYAISAVFAALYAIAAYLKLPGVRENLIDADRAIGPFKDPNVLGSYSILGVLILMQAALFGSKLLRPVNIVLIGVVLFGGIFLPLSRGAWGAMAFATLYFGIVTFWTDRASRRKIMVGAIVLGLMGGGVVAYVGSQSSLQTTVSDRAKLTQEYDSGYTGRFGNQKRALMMLVERPLGFGPHRFAFYFDLDPHDSYIGAFSSAGWIGGFGFLALVIATGFLAVRLSIRSSPYRPYARVVAPALISAFLQAFQIDIDHWRFLYFMVGCVWGLEAARLRYQSRERLVAAERPHGDWSPSPMPSPVAP